MKPQSLYTLALVGLLLMTLAGPAQAFRCNGRLVDIGDWPTEVRDKCGDPDYVNHFPSTILPGLGPIQATEHWYYNPGPRRFIRRLIFRDGKLRHLETLGRGFVTREERPCTPEDIDRGMSEFELYSHCGEPLEQRTEWRMAHPRKYPGHPQQVMPVEEWLYEFGRTRFRQVIRLEAGEVVGMERRDKPR